MARKTVSGKLRNLARGGENYRRLRWRVFAILSENPNVEADPLSDYLSGTFFSLTSHSYKFNESQYVLHALPMRDRDWPILQKLAGTESVAFSQSYMRLVVSFIQSNRAAVKRMIEFEAEISRDILYLQPNSMLEALISLSPIDKQSLFAFKLYCALNADRHESIADYFSQNPHSDWVRQHLLYPLIFYFMNAPSKETFDQVLAQIFPHPGQRRSELELVRFCLTEDQDLRLPISVKCYAALLCHPYDAFSLFVSHFEALVANAKQLGDVEIALLTEIYEATGSSRVLNLLNVALKVPVKFSVSPSDFPLGQQLKLDDVVSQFFVQFLGTGATIDGPDRLPGILPQLAALRSNRYPTQADFIEAVIISRRYGFCDAGKLVTIMLTSLYMVERRAPADEVVHLIRHLYFFGLASPFFLCSPRSYQALDSNVIALDNDKAEILTDEALASCCDEGRWWIKRLHWQARNEQRAMKVAGWLERVRHGIPLSGNSRFLSGIDWAWIDEVIRALRIKPFQGQVNGIYVLLMRAMEQRQRDPNSLMLALAPFASSEGGVAVLVERLIREYKTDATAFVRFFLTPSMILKMRLETNYTAALSERLNALEFCAAAFGFNDDVMTSQQFANEQHTLTASLTFIALGTAQFELPWEIFTADVMNGVADEYKTYLAVNKTYNAVPLLSDARTKSSHVFRNKEIRTYEFPNREWPLALAICSIIDTFLSHPSYGIESILAIRIRHDNLRREFALALASLRRTKFPSVTQYERDQCIKVLEAQVYAVLQSWIDAHMHTRKRKVNRGIFEFLPDQDEMSEFVQKLRNTPLLVVIEEVVSWLKARLNASLGIARGKLDDELSPALKSAIEQARRSFLGSEIRADALDRIAGTAEMLTMRKAAELRAWFEMPKGVRREGLSYSDLKLAVDGRFQHEVASGRLIVSFSDKRWSDKIIRAENIRSTFDLWSELTLNALKYSNCNPVRVRIKGYKEGAVEGLRFSSLKKGPDTGIEHHSAEPTSVDEPMLKAGKSGLKIIASLSASILRKASEIYVDKRLGSYHVFVPFEVKSK